MDLKSLIQTIKQSLNETDDFSVLSDWDLALTAEYAFVANELAEVKKHRATKELDIKKTLLNDEGKYTEKEIERRYFATEEGQYLAWAGEELKAIGKLISAIRFRRDVLRR
jgi:hypothetical protein